MFDASRKLLRVSNLSKNFRHVEALSGAGFELQAGEILGVVGQRGSGKSTLLRLLSGVMQPTNGEIYINEERVHLRSAIQAKNLGIESVYQYPVLADNLTVQQNIFLGREICQNTMLKLWPKDGEMANSARAVFKDFGIAADIVNEYPTSLSNEYKQITAIVRALSQKSSLLILDEPLAALNYQRQQKLIKLLKNLSVQNVSIIISSDDLKHIFSLTDRILVLYKGRQIAIRQTSKTTPRDIVELIVGSSKQEQVTPVIWAFENYHAAQKQAEKLRHVQEELQQSLRVQDSLNRQLFERLQNQMSALDGLNHALQDANRRLITEREAERKALARDLHDQIIQDLLSFNYQLENAESTTGDENLSEELASIRNGIREAVSSLRQICSDLRPPTIDSHGLSAAIRSLTHQWSKQNNIEVDLNVDPQLGRLPELIELSVFRIIQEGLSNIRKHSNATRVRLALRRTANASLEVELHDNGQGMTNPVDLGALSGEQHYGLVGMFERVSLLGGTIQIKSPAEKGVQIHIEIPSPYPLFNN